MIFFTIPVIAEEEIEKEEGTQIKLEFEDDKYDGNSTDSLTDLNNIPIFTTGYSFKQEDMIGMDELFLNHGISRGEISIENISLFQSISNPIAYSTNYQKTDNANYIGILMLIIVFLSSVFGASFYYKRKREKADNNDFDIYDI